MRRRSLEQKKEIKEIKSRFSGNTRCQKLDPFGHRGIDQARTKTDLGPSCLALCPGVLFSVFLLRHNMVVSFACDYLQEQQVGLGPFRILFPVPITQFTSNTRDKGLDMPVIQPHALNIESAVYCTTESTRHNEWTPSPPRLQNIIEIASKVPTTKWD